jgi:ribosomal protein S20
MFNEKLSGGQVDDAKSRLPQLYSDIDSAVDQGVLSRNAAARHKSRLSKHLNNAVAPPTAK